MQNQITKEKKYKNLEQFKESPIQSLILLLQISDDQTSKEKNNFDKTSYFKNNQYEYYKKRTVLSNQISNDINKLNNSMQQALQDSIIQEKALNKLRLQKQRKENIKDSEIQKMKGKMNNKLLLAFDILKQMKLMFEKRKLQKNIILKNKNIMPPHNYQK